MQIFQSKYDFVTSKRFNNKIKEYEKLGFEVTNSVINDCNLAYLDQVLFWLNPNLYLSCFDNYLLYTDKDNQKYCIQSNGAYQLFGKHQFLRPFSFIKDVLGFNKYQTYYILHIFLKKVNKTDIAHLIKATYPSLKQDVPIDEECLNHYKDFQPSNVGLANLYGIYEKKYHIDHNLLSTLMFNRFITLDEQGNIYYQTSYYDKVVSVYNLSADELYCNGRSVGSFFAEHPSSQSISFVKRLFVFSDILDMLSFITLYRNNMFSSFRIFKAQTGYLSLNGNNYDEFTRFMNQHPNIQTVFDCTKNQGYHIIREFKQYSDDANNVATANNGDNANNVGNADNDVQADNADNANNDDKTNKADNKTTTLNNSDLKEAELKKHLEYNFYLSYKYINYRMESRFKKKLKQWLGEDVFYMDLRRILKNYNCGGSGVVSWQVILQKEYLKGNISTNEQTDSQKEVIDKLAIKKTAKKKNTEKQKLNANDIKVGDAVEHNKYGIGIVKEITDKIVIVSFNVEEKKFPFPMAFDDKFLFQCKNEQSTPITDVGESYIPTSIFDIGLPDDYLPF